jgi:hypothetical protein
VPARRAVGDRRMAAHPEGRCVIADSTHPTYWTSRSTGHLDAQLGRTIPGLRASTSTGSVLSQISGLPSVVGRQETPILIFLVPSTDEDITLLAADLLRTGAKRSRSMLGRTEV